MSYSKQYHCAINHLIEYGIHGGNTNEGRNKIAIALRQLRIIDRNKAQRERHHMIFICGSMPVK